MAGDAVIEQHILQHRPEADVMHDQRCSLFTHLVGDDADMGQAAPVTQVPGDNIARPVIAGAGR